MLPLSQITPILRVLSGLAVGVGALYCAACAIIIAIGTILLVPNFLYYSLNDPFTPLLSTIAYIGTALACGAVCVTALYIAYNLIRGNDLTKGTLLAGAFLLAIMLGCRYIALPILAAPFIS